MSFIHDFVEYNSGNECPTPYVIWTAYGLLSAAIGPRIYLDLDYFFVRCDTYILLIGPSGGRKTASMLLGLELLREAIPDISLAGDNETYQGILGYLDSDNSTRSYVHDEKEEKYKPYHIFSEELMDYLQLNPVAMVTFLTNIYGKKAYIYRLKHEEKLLVNPYVTMCACSVPEWLTDQLKAKQFSEGYGRRTILVCHEGIVRKKPHKTQAMSDAGQRCILHLRSLVNIIGEAKLEPAADAFFWKWYVTQRDPDDLFMRNWYSTRHMNLLKVAMLSSISERSDRVVTLDHIQLALGLLEEVEAKIVMITARMGRSEVVEPAMRLLATLRNHGGVMSEKELKMATYKEFRDGVEQFRVIEFLRQTGQIVVEELPIDGVKRRMVALSDALKKG